MKKKLHDLKQSRAKLERLCEMSKPIALPEVCPAIKVEFSVKFCPKIVTESTNLNENITVQVQTLFSSDDAHSSSQLNFKFNYRVYIIFQVVYFTFCEVPGQHDFILLNINWDFALTINSAC